jgi:hypothetical protein
MGARSRPCRCEGCADRKPAATPHSDAVSFWVETRLRAAIDDPVHIMFAGSVLAESHRRGDPPDLALRTVLAGFVANALGVRL